MSWRMMIDGGAYLLEDKGNGRLLIGGDGPLPLATAVTPPGPPPGDAPSLDPRPGEDLSDFIWPADEGPQQGMTGSGDRTVAVSRLPPGSVFYTALPGVGNPGDYRNAGIIAEGARTDYGAPVGGNRLWLPKKAIETIDPRGPSSMVVQPPAGYLIRRMLKTGHL